MQSYFKLFLFFFYLPFQPFFIFTRKSVWIPLFLSMLSMLSHFLVFQVGKWFSCNRFIEDFIAMFFFSAISQIHKWVRLDTNNFLQCLSTLFFWVIWLTVFMWPLVDDFTVMSVFQTRKWKIQKLKKKSQLAKTSTFR